MNRATLDRIPPPELGRRLQAARKARGLTQEEVARHLEVSRTTVTAMEKGDRPVKPEELATLARLYGRTINVLVSRREATEPFSVQFRATLQPQQYEETEIEPHIFEFQRLCEDYLELERLVGASLRTSYPPPYQADFARPEQAAEDVANRERQRLGLGDAPILNLRETLETDVGLRIFYMELPSRVAAMFAYSEELGGCIAVNRKHPPERRRLSLGHDFGHFLTDRFRPEVAILDRYERVPARERFAETFGSAFLLPGTGLSRRFNDLHGARSGKITPADLCTLAHYFFVSFEVLTRRLEELDLVPSGTWARLKELGFRVEEAKTLLRLPEHEPSDHVLPTRYQYLAAEAFARGDLTEGQLARLLRTDRVAARRLIYGLGHRAGISEEGEVTLESLDLGSPI
jgi:Zn-dependent peptidase ImmA (M78 family)